MKRLVASKIAKVTLFAIIFVLVMPVAAYAAVGYTNLSYSNGTVTGTVYVSEDTNGGFTVTDDVYIDVFNHQDGYVATITDTVYTTVTTDTYGNRLLNFDFSLNVGVFPYLKLFERVTDAVYGTVTHQASGGGPGGGDGGGGGGGSGNGGGDSGPVKPDDSIIRLADGEKLDANRLKQALAAHTHVTIVIEGEYVSLPAEVLAAYADTNATITVTDGAVDYILPLRVVPYSDISQKLGLNSAAWSLEVHLTKVTGKEKEAMEQRMAASGLKPIAEHAYEFKLIASAGEGETIEIEDFGQTYVHRTFHLDKSVDKNTVAGVLYDAEQGKFYFVPSIVEEQDGEASVTIKRNSNSIYTVVSYRAGFTDIAGHWARDTVQTLGNKLIIQGDSPTIFAPERSITRAEMAALLVRSLGLKPAAYDRTFSDIAAADWYAAEIAAAAKAGIVQGDPDGSFRPNDLVTREELSAMIVRSLGYTGKKLAIPDAETARLLTQFTDRASIEWGHEEMALAVHYGIIIGTPSGRLEPVANATRAEAATMLHRMLIETDFMN